MRRTAALSLCAVLVVSCGGSPTGPGSGQPVPASFGGVWAIEYLVTDCAGYRHCFAFLNTTRTGTLRLAPAGAGFDGVMNVSHDNIDVSGSVTGGTLQLRGVRRPAVANDVEMEITKLDLTAHGLGATGALEYITTGPSNSSFFGAARIGGAITRARRISPAAAAGWTGAWQGRAAVRDCSSIGWPDCYPHGQRDVHTFDLALTEHGSSVTGTLLMTGATIDVRGTRSAGSVTIEGSSVSPNYAFDEVRTLRPSTLTSDKVGRLSGNISILVEWPPKLPDLWTYKSTDLRVIELLNVAVAPPS